MNKIGVAKDKTLYIIGECYNTSLRLENIHQSTWLQYLISSKILNKINQIAAVQANCLAAITGYLSTIYLYYWQHKL